VLYETSRDDIIYYMKFIVVIMALLLPLVSVSAHGTVFYEFNPDSATGLNIVSTNESAQLFLPQNEFLGGMDFWVDNSGSPGPVTFELYNENNVLITTKTVTVPTILPISGGKKLNFDFNNQLSVSDNEIYTLKIISTLPNLNFYYANRIKLLGHNDPYVSQY